MRSLINAIQFITIIPLGRPDRFEPQRIIPYFPLVGVLLGGMLCIVDSFASTVFQAPVAAMIDVVFLIVITGAFHLDGLGDAADGLFSHRSRERALEIMKDSRIGVMGLVAIISVLALKWGGIQGLQENRMLLLVLIPCLSRSGMLFGIRFLEYGRPEGGSGHDFFNEPLKLSAFWGLSVPLLLAGLIGMRGLYIIIGFAVLTAGILVFYKRKMGCITGDMLGAMAETLEALLFLLASADGIR